MQIYAGILVGVVTIYIVVKYCTKCRLTDSTCRWKTAVSVQETSKERDIICKLKCSLNNSDISQRAVHEMAENRAETRGKT
jgi:hypothetical protein